ncbi:hypothetical protein IQ270_09790 [Microcoleus sp. LEGE 07076]|uniref:hypothetical protein n=1 Tax=Microcoleus sp. LEGE 07076 TaxID=915322 RepID=UPI001881CF81|nr:hypothetical protein [Microcoleus sp. LEGE 07076]MBE9184997.1 hypothetical protein [Microcoleus sp. LEGE 07076]
MTFFDRKFTKKSPAPVPVADIKQAGHEEPLGHLHPNFRQWVWLNPSHHRAQ